MPAISASPPAPCSLPLQSCPIQPSPKLPSPQLPYRGLFISHWAPSSLATFFVPCIPPPPLAIRVSDGMLSWAILSSPCPIPSEAFPARPQLSSQKSRHADTDIIQDSISPCICAKHIYRILYFIIPQVCCCHHSDTLVPFFSAIPQSYQRPPTPTGAYIGPSPSTLMPSSTSSSFAETLSSTNLPPHPPLSHPPFTTTPNTPRRNTTATPSNFRHRSFGIPSPPHQPGLPISPFSS